MNDTESVKSEQMHKTITFCLERTHEKEEKAEIKQ